MGDHRGELNATFEFHGKKYTYGSGYVNWDPYGSVERVKKWPEECWDDGYSRYVEQVEGPARRAQEEVEERQELVRLKAKYETSKP